MIYALYEYSELQGKYVFYTNLEESDFISYNYVEYDSRKPNIFNAQLKGVTRIVDVPKYDELFPNDESDLANLKPLIIVKETSDGQVIWFAFITTRVKIEDNLKRMYEFSGVDFKYFTEYKLIESNKDYPVGSYDPDNLPDNFGKYQATTTLQDHLQHAYNSFITPKELTYGRIATVGSDVRKFKGLNSVTINYGGGETKDIQSDIRDIFTFQLECFERFGVTLETKQQFDKVNGVIDIIIQERQELSIDVIRNNDDVINRETGCTLRGNYIFGYADPNIDTNQYVLESYDFTTLEKAEDVSFVSGSNQTYADNTTSTILRDANDNKFIKEIQVAPTSAFIDIRAGDLAPVNDKVYLITKLEEKNSINGLQFFVDIKEI